jgi:hypothetical protein
MSAKGPTIESVSKLDAARRQLKTAIRLFFHEGDTVSICTLAEASRELLNDLLDAKGTTNPLREAARDHVKPEYWKEYVAFVNRPKNFFKHADRDADAVLEFRPEVTAFTMFEAVVDYQLFTGRRLREGVVLELWVALNYPQMIKQGQYADALDELKRDLGRIPTKAIFRSYLDRGDLFPNMD